MEIIIGTIKLAFILITTIRIAISTYTFCRKKRDFEKFLSFYDVNVNGSSGVPDPPDILIVLFKYSDGLT